MHQPYAAPRRLLAVGLTVLLGLLVGPAVAVTAAQAAPAEEDLFAPEAVATATPSTAEVGEPITFSGEGSSDLDLLSTLTYSWGFGDGSPRGTEQVVTHAYAQAGTYTAVLTVTDSEGLTDTANVQVQVLPVNTPPVARLSAGPLDPVAGEGVGFSAADSTDAETPSDLAYSWAFGDGTVGTGRDVTHAYAAAGDYTATLRVTDPRGASDVEQVSLSVQPAPPPGDQQQPRTRFLVEPADLYAKRTRTLLSGELSSDNETPTSSLDYSWRISGPGRDTTDDRRRFRHVFATPGRYRVALTTTDRADNSSTVAKKVRVWRWRDCQADVKRLHLRGDWDTVRGAGADGDHCRGREGAVLTYRFEGKQLHVRHGASRRGGHATVTIDGERMKGIPFDRDGRLRFGATRSYRGLGAGTHLVRIEVRRGPAYLDSLISFS